MTRTIFVGLLQISGKQLLHNYIYVPPKQIVLRSGDSGTKNETELFDEIIDLSKESKVIFV